MQIEKRIEKNIAFKCKFPSPSRRACRVIEIVLHPPSASWAT